MGILGWDEAVKSLIKQHLTNRFFLPPVFHAESTLRAGNPTEIRKLINIHFTSIWVCVNTVHELFFPHLCSFPQHLSVNDQILIYFAGLNGPDACILSQNLSSHC